MIVENYWQEFLRSHPEIDSNTKFDVWYFGDSRELADELCELVLKGVKTATASLVWEYETRPDEAPKLNGYSVVTDFDGNPKCILKTTEINLVPFDKVDAQFAFDEGEGDRSLEYWRDVHWAYYLRACEKIGKERTEDMIVICERFVKLYPTS